ncbi:MAG TPA: HAMP domain-containing protein, partial [Bdellovibrionota bacterium]|nr:HAMP domain-containing protein [Bdellovibrionota bacterium]
MSFSAIVARFTARSLGASLAQLNEHAERMAGGDFRSRVDLGDGAPFELERLARTMNRASAQLDQRIRVLTEQNAALE